MISSREFLIGLGGLCMIASVVNLFFILFVAYTKMDAVLELMSNATHRSKRTPYWRGPKGRFILLGELMGIIIFPKSAIKLQTATLEEIESIPEPFKILVTRMAWIDVILVVWCIIFLALGKGGLLT